MTYGRAYVQDGPLFRVRQMREGADGALYVWRYLGPYATLGAARGQAREGDVVETASPDWKEVSA